MGRQMVKLLQTFFLKTLFIKRNFLQPIFFKILLQDDKTLKGKQLTKNFTAQFITAGDLTVG